MRHFKIAVAAALCLNAAALNEAMGKECNPNLPARVVEITVDAAALEELKHKLGEFADANAFAIRISQSSPNPWDILVQMWREDVKIIGSRSPEPITENVEYGVGFYCNGTRLVPESAFAKLASDLRETLHELSGVVSIRDEER